MYAGLLKLYTDLAISRAQGVCIMVLFMAEVSGGRLPNRETQATIYLQEKDHALTTASQRTLEHGQVCMAADNLFHRCITRSKVRAIISAPSLVRIFNSITACAFLPLKSVSHLSPLASMSGRVWLRFVVTFIGKPTDKGSI